MRWGRVLHTPYTSPGPGLPVTEVLLAPFCPADWAPFGDIRA